MLEEIIVSLVAKFERKLVIFAKSLNQKNQKNQKTKNRIESVKRYHLFGESGEVKIEGIIFELPT